MPEIFDKNRYIDLCRNSVDYFFKNCIIRELKYPTRVQPKYFGVTPTESQKSLLDDIRNNSFILVNQSRKVGITTFIQGYTLWLTQLFEGKKVLYHNVTTVQSIQSLVMLGQLYSLMPSFSRVGVANVAPMYIKFDNKSEVHCYNPGSSKHDSTKFDLIYVDNATFNKDLYRDLTKLHSMLTETGTLVCGSTLYKESPFTYLCYLAETGGEVPFIYKKFTHIDSKKRDRPYINRLLERLPKDDMLINEYAAYYTDRNGEIKHITDYLSQDITLDLPLNIPKL